MEYGAADVTRISRMKSIKGRLTCGHRCLFWCRLSASLRSNFRPHPTLVHTCFFSGLGSGLRPSLAAISSNNLRCLSDVKWRSRSFTRPNPCQQPKHLYFAVSKGV